MTRATQTPTAAPRIVLEHFEFDDARFEVTAEPLADRGYDPGVALFAGRSYATWLEHSSGGGDALWLAVRDADGAWTRRAVVPPDAETKLGRPTLTATGGSLWLTYELESEQGGVRRWSGRRARVRTGTLELEPETELFEGFLSRHAAAPGPDDSLRVAVQAPGETGFEIRSADGDSTGTRSGYGWHPDLASRGARGEACLVWDAFDGESFGIRARWLGGAELAIDPTPRFQARAAAALDSAGRAWIGWEEGAENWGRAYRGNDREWNNVTDGYGPVHSTRRLRIARLERDGTFREPLPPLPMPAFERAASLPDRRTGAAAVGVFYERPQVVVDGNDRPWIVYRHAFARQVAARETLDHHVEAGWKLYARCLEEGGWSPLYRFDVGQRDGMQRLSVVGTVRGIALAWSSGRTDRRTQGRGPTGVFFASLERAGRAPGEDQLGPVEHAGRRTARPTHSEHPRVELGGTEWKLAFGDLHRHTDLSLCFPFFDGSIDDAYRYAIEVAGLDYLGITDHTRDIDRGDVRSQLWWRCRKEVSRHHLPGSFAPFYAYERSHGDTDHNVISLRDDMLRPFRPPLSELWEEIEDGTTITIPHRTDNVPGEPFNGRVWDGQDDARRPLVEVYQGFRDRSALQEALVPLARGFHLGYIASSDHLSTDASFACVWTPTVSRSALFDSLASRRTYAATDRIELVFSSTDHWMGERFTTPRATVPFHAQVRGTAALESLELWLDGERYAHVPAPADRHGAGDGYRMEADWTVELAPGGEHYAFVRVLQGDGHRAWSSPIWVARTP